MCKDASLLETLMGIKYADFSPVYGMSGVHGMLSPSLEPCHM